MKKYFHLIKQAVLSVLGRTTTPVAPAPVVDTTDKVLMDGFQMLAPAKEYGFSTATTAPPSMQVSVGKAKVSTLVVAPNVVAPVAEVVVTLLPNLEVHKRQPRKKKDHLEAEAPVVVEAADAPKPKRTRRSGKKKE